jgi:hypothetical protein
MPLDDQQLAAEGRRDAEEIACIRAGSVYAWDWWLWLLAGTALWQLAAAVWGMIG